MAAIRNQQSKIRNHSRASLLLAVLLALTACGRSASGGSTYQGTALSGLAPDFALQDQAGAARRLSDFRGQVVVLAFLDPQCQDVCPRLAHDLRDLNDKLGARAARVALVGVNVNAAANQPADLAQASAGWGLDALATWHFLSGQPDALASVWRDYSVAAEPDPQQPGRVMHSAAVYIIDAGGHWRWFLSPPGADEPDASLADLLRGHVLELLTEQPG